MIEANKTNVEILIITNNDGNNMVPQDRHKFVEISCEVGNFTIYEELAEMWNIKENSKVTLEKALDLLFKNAQYGKMICQKALGIPVDIPNFLNE